MGYHLNHLDEPVFIAVSKPLLTEFGIYLRLESCVRAWFVRQRHYLEQMKTFGFGFGFVFVLAHEQAISNTHMNSLL